MGILKRRTLIVPGAALTAMQKRRRKPLPFRHLFVGPPSPLMQSKRTKLQQLFCAAKKADAVVEAFAPPPPPRRKRRVARAVFRPLPEGPAAVAPARGRAFLEFMARRDKARKRKEAGRPWPWSKDAILRARRFTNVKREDDRTTRWLRDHHGAAHRDAPAGEVLINCAVFRAFGTVAHAERYGWRASFDADACLGAAEACWRAGPRNGVPRIAREPTAARRRPPRVHAGLPAAALARLNPMYEMAATAHAYPAAQRFTDPSFPV